MTDPADIQAHDHFHDTIGHVVPMRLLVGVFVMLLIFTAITVMATWYDTGSPFWNVAIAMGIAAVKAILVGLYFMHLRWDSPFNSMVLIVSILFVALFVIFALTDSFFYAPNFDPHEPARIGPG